MSPPVGRYYLGLVLSRWKPLLAIVVTVTLGAWLVTVLLLDQFPKFEGVTRLNIVPTTEELSYANHFESGSTFDGGSVLLQTYGEYAHTRPIVAPIIDRYVALRAKAAGQSVDAWLAANAVPPLLAPGPWISWLQYGATPPVPPKVNLLNKLVQNTTLDTVEGTYLLRVTVDWSDPESAAFFANALSASIVDEATAMSRVSGHEIANSLTSQLAATQALLEGRLRQSRALKQSIGVVDIDRQKQSLLDARAAEMAQLTSDQSDLVGSRARVSDLQALSRGKMSLAQQAMQQTLAVEAPKLQGLQQGIAVRQARIAAIDSQIASLATHEQSVKTLDDQIDTLQTEVKALQVRQSFAQTENLANAPRIRLIESAVPPLTRTSPKALFNTALGFIAGCALAGCWLLLFDDAAPAEPVDDRPIRHVDPPFDRTPEPVVERAPPRRGPVEAEYRPAPSIARRVAREPEPVMAGMATTMVIDRPAPSGDVPPVAASHRATAPDNVFDGSLPRPLDGRAYDAGEVAVLGPRIAAWLAAPLGSPGRTMAIVATGDDREAQTLYQLIYEHIRAAGGRLRTIDGTRQTVPPPAPGDAARLLVYGGGFGESAKLAMLAELDADASVVIAVDAREIAVDGVVAEFQQSIAEITGKIPYVVALGD